ncbi:MAG: DsrE family protein [Nitrospinae bacterium]|jgi:hypothetical protein|nr:DsrE family protein [Nitrospinota bacterium]MDA1108988.1 DsrE family protein [Nitrospinota bacterium]
MKTAIIVMSDPKSGDEAFGRLFNGLATAYESKTQGDDVTVAFLGAGSRWPEIVSKADHPAHALFEEIKGSIAGVSCGCADVFGASEGVKACGVNLLKDNPIPGTNGVASLRKYVKEGYTILSF